MEVTFIDENDSHMIIGGGKARSFAIATTAEFVQVLSDALYSDKKLAVVREVMCNAWDAHIVAGKEDTAIVVSITGNKLKIQDFGNGIPDDQIEDIYCTYGESTKRHDSNTTGGFGLGSKAPFAISDTFTVTSCHNGTKTTYAVSKGNEDSDGLPVLIPVVSLPTTESGVTVEIPINFDEFSEFGFLIKRVALFGEMKVKYIVGDFEHTFSDKLLGLKSSEMNFILTSEYPSYKKLKSGYAAIQYGSVIYPIEDNDAYSEVFQKILNKIVEKGHWHGTSGYSYRNIIIKAPPNSLSVAPSREALSYNKHTIENLKEILNETWATLNKVYPDRIRENLINFIEFKLKEEDLQVIDSLNKFSKFVKFIGESIQETARASQLEGDEVINTVENLHKNYLECRYTIPAGSFKNFIPKYLFAHLKKQKDKKYLRMLKDLLKSADNTYTLNTSKYYKQRNLWLSPLYHEIDRELHRKYGTNGWHKYRAIFSNTHGEFEKVTINRVYNYHNDSLNPFRIIIANNISSIKKFINHNNELWYRSRNGDYKGFQEKFVNALVIPKNKEKTYNLTEIADYLESLGYTVDRVWEALKYQPVRIASVKSDKSEDTVKRSKKGYALLRECVNAHNQLQWSMFPNASRIDNPEVMVITATKNHRTIVENLPDEVALQHFLKAYPNTVIASNSTTRQNAKKKFPNLMTEREALKKYMDKLIKDPQTKTKLIQAYTFRYADDNYRYLALIDEIATKFGLVNISNSDISDIDAQITMWRSYVDHYEYKKLISEVEKEAEQAATKLPNLDIVEKAKRNLGLLDSYFWKVTNKLDDDRRKMVIEMLTIALKG